MYERAECCPYAAICSPILPLFGPLSKSLAFYFLFRKRFLNKQQNTELTIEELKSGNGRFKLNLCYKLNEWTTTKFSFQEIGGGDENNFFNFFYFA